MKGKGQVAAPNKVIRPKLEQEQITLVPEAKSEEETGQKGTQNVRMYSPWILFLVQ